MEVYVIVGICVAASLGLYALMRRNQDKDTVTHVQSYREHPAGLEDDVIGPVRVVSAEEYDPGERKAEAETVELEVATAEKAPIDDSELLVMYVAAGNKGQFVGYELMQSLMAQGLQTGPMDIVHRYDEDGRIIFSVASAAGAGTIDLTNMGDFATPGLCFFIYPKKAVRPRHAFNEMVDCAIQLADELDGQVLDQNREPWTMAFEQSKRQALPVYQPQSAEATM
ncbi:MAG: zipA [Gammaproteobacteria bacterium]|nr:zipA [Gammaproteobacteria bacterium]